MATTQIEEMATQLQRDSRKAENLNSQASEQASIVTVALPRGFLVSAVLTYFSDSLASLDDTKS
jgi:hypothetical protein